MDKAILLDPMNPALESRLLGLLNRWLSQHRQGGATDPCGVAPALVEETRSAVEGRAPAARSAPATSDHLTRVVLDALRVKVQTGAGLSLPEQRALLAHVDRLTRQDDDNLNRLVLAREKFDRLAKMDEDGSRLSKDLLAGLMELGSILGRGA